MKYKLTIEFGAGHQGHAEKIVSTDKKLSNEEKKRLWERTFEHIQSDAYGNVEEIEK